MQTYNITVVFKDGSSCQLRVQALDGRVLTTILNRLYPDRDKQSTTVSIGRIETMSNMNIHHEVSTIEASEHIKRMLPGGCYLRMGYEFITLWYMGRKYQITQDTRGVFIECLSDNSDGTFRSNVSRAMGYLAFG